MTSPSDPQRSPWDGGILLAPGAALYRGDAGDADWHAHFAVQIAASLDGPFAVALEDRLIEARAAVIPSGVRHRLLGRSRRMSLLLIEPSLLRGTDLASMAAGADLQRAGGLAPFLELLADAEGRAPLARLLELLPARAGRSARSEDLAPPVRRAVEYLDERSNARPRLDEAAALGGVSPTHLTHRFTAEVGIPFRRYALWARLRAAVEHVAAGRSLTDAASAAGFSDSAHLSRTFRANFGLPPSTLLAMEIEQDAWPEHPGRGPRR